MRKEIKTYETVCDCCGKILTDTGIRTNGGRFEEPYLKHGEIDLCYICAGKIFYRDVVRKVPEDKVREWAKNLRKAEGPNPLGPDLHDLEIPDIFKKIEDNPYYIKPEINSPVDYPTATFDKTTGVNEMIPAACEDKLQPTMTDLEGLSNSAPSTNIKFLGDL